MDPEIVVEGIQSEASLDGAQSVAVVAGAEIAAVGSALEEHAELSEERHEEILEAEEWLQARLEVLLTTVQGIQSEIPLSEGRLLVEIRLVEGRLLMEIQKLFTGLNPSTPLPEPQAPLEAVAVEIPPSSEGAAAPSEARTESGPPVHRRRLI